MKKKILALTLSLASCAAAAVTPEEVGDADSFGLPVIYLGLADTITGYGQADCSNEPPLPQTKCITLLPQPASTTFDEPRSDSIELPANATRSLLCFTLTPSAHYELRNQTGVWQPLARFQTQARITIENPVLNDVINPDTGESYDGHIDWNLSVLKEARSLPAGEMELKNMLITRSCIGGIVSTRSLVETHGLTPEQAKAFFASPMTVYLGFSGSVQLVTSMGLSYGMRLYGDRR